jgi:nitrite reductase/ring-hydroxylating ferredoxin subunit
VAEHRVARASAVPAGEARGFSVAGTEIVLCRVDDEIYALQGMCTHQELPLDGGEVEGGVLTCEWHGATFDVCTGRVLGPRPRATCAAIPYGWTTTEASGSSFPAPAEPPPGVRYKIVAIRLSLRLRFETSPK